MFEISKASPAACRRCGMDAMLAASFKVVKTALDISAEFSTMLLTFLLLGADNESVACPIVVIFEFAVV